MSEKWVEELIQKQIEHQEDEDLGKLYLEKGVSRKQKNSISASGRYKGRPDAGTRATESKKHEDDRDDVRQVNDFKESKRSVFGKQDLEVVEDNTSGHDLESEGDWMSDEFTALSRGDTAHIGPGTEFPDGSYIDSEGDLRSPDQLGVSTRDEEGNPLTDAEIEKLQKEAFETELARKKTEEVWEREQDRKTRSFVAGQTYRGKRLGDQNARKM